MTSEQTDGTCWQCGASADSDCVHVENLVHRADHADGQGYPVTRTRWGKNAVEVPIPRCQACQIRNDLSGFLIFAGVSIGAGIGMIQFPSRGITTIIGAAVGSLPGVLLILYYRMVMGLRSVADFPPLKRLREAGWEEPG
jgi:hypothetical protein